MNLNPIPRLKQFYENSQRILSISYKPNTSEFMRTLKIVLLGTLVLGIMGYVISLIIGAIV